MTAARSRQIPDTPFPAYRARYLPAMTSAQIETLPQRASAVVVLPTGSIEQHGPHLPVGVDSVLGQAWLGAALAHVPATIGVYVAPPITYAVSDEHTGFAGTVSIGPKLFHRLVLASARQIKALGFRTLAVLNTHGGNSPTLVATLREIQSSLEMNACMIAPAWKPPVDAQEAAYGFHAGRVETAWMLALAPHLVHMDRATTEYPARIDDPGTLRPERAPATFSWATADVSRSGVMGDARAATVEEGREWFDAGAHSLAAQIIKLSEAVARQRTFPR
jgi:creatinine amidohydrolase